MRSDDFPRRFFDGLARYRWLETLGRGGAGVVFKALDLELDEIVAIKFLAPDSFDDEDNVSARFKREVELSRQIWHPNVAKIYDFGTHAGTLYFTMEYIDGEDLWTIIHREGRLPEARAVPLLRQILRGTEAIHQAGIVHRDLKSQNVLMTAAGGVAILDFGLARGHPSERFTLHTSILGTPDYMSPEQAEGAPVDARSDIYAVGIIAFEMLTGRVPFTGTSPIAIAMKQITEPVPDTLAKRTDISQGLKAIVHKALSKRREDRFPVAEEMEIALATLKSPAADSELPNADAIADALESHLDALFPHEAGPVMPGSAGSVSRVFRRTPLALVVRHDHAGLLTLASEVAKAGCKTIEAHDARGALIALQKRNVNLVVLDAALPHRDGCQVTRTIRSLNRFDLVPILVITEFPDRDMAARAIQAGATDVLSEPLDAEQLAFRIGVHMRRLGFAPRESDGPRTLKRRR